MAAGTVFEENGHGVALAANSRECLGRVEAERPDAILGSIPPFGPAQYLSASVLQQILCQSLPQAFWLIAIAPDGMPDTMGTVRCRHEASEAQPARPVDRGVGRDWGRTPAAKSLK